MRMGRPSCSCAWALALAAVATVATVGVGRAQSAPNANLHATAEVIAEPVLVQEQRDLSFGDVFTGTNVTVPVNSASSGRWLVTGRRAGEVRLTFDLPTQLLAGAYTLPITFGPTSAGHNVSNVPHQATLFDPSVGAQTTIRDEVESEELYVWIGASVSAALDQAEGTYAGTITLTVAYTGN